MKKIVLVEDNTDILDNMAEILELAGYKVFTAENGKAGFHQAKNNQPDIIISDIMMPELDGFGLLHLLQKQTELQDIPFIFLTAKTDRPDFRKGMEMGADDYITKPFNDTELLNAIERRLEKENRRKNEPKEIFPIDQNKNDFLMEEFIRGREVNQYRKKELLFTEDNSPHFLYYIVKGKLKAFKISDSGKELIVGLYHANEFVGYAALLENARYNVSVSALEDSEIILIPGIEFIDKVRKNAKVSMFFIRLLAEKNNQKVEQMIHLAYASVKKRVASAILFLMEAFGKEVKEPFAIDITREELSHLSGTTTETLIRTLRAFKDEKLIKIKNGSVRVINKKGLNRLLN